MIRCLECGEEFENASFDEENECEVCPYCGTEDIEEIDEGYDAYNATQREREDQPGCER